MAFARSEVRRYNGVPTIFVEGQPLHGIAEASGALDDPAAVRALVEGGCQVLAIPVEAGIHCWTAEGQYDWSYAEEKLAFFEKHGADTRWIIRVRLGLLAPWFARACPTEVHNRSIPDPETPITERLTADTCLSVANVASPVWNEKVCGLVRALVAWLKTTRWAPRIIGFILNAGSTEEWLVFDTDETTRGRYHEVYTREFRAWLRRTYADESALRAAWNDPAATFDAASCPMGHMRRGSHVSGPFSLRDPAVERPAIDYYRFLNATLADHFIAVCRAAKGAAGTPILCGGFGNALWRESGVYSTIQETGHGLVQRLKESPWVDFVAISDFRLPIAAAPEDFSGPWERKLPKIGRRALDWDRNSVSQVAFVCSEDTPMFQAAMSGDLLRFELDCHRALLLGAASRAWRLAGVPFDTYGLHDLAHPDFPGDQYRLLVFVNCARVSDRAAEGIRRWQNADRVLCWTYAAAVLDEERLDPAIGADLVGMRLGWKRERRQIRVLVDDSGYPLTQGGERLGFGTEGPVGPVFFADDPEACVFGRLRDGGEPAFALRHHDGWKSAYLAMLNFGPQLLRNLARFAGAHVWCESDDAIYANRSLVCLHAASAGEKVIRLPAPAIVTDLWTGERSSAPLDTIRIAMPANGARLWRMEARYARSIYV